jgi:hypothetical protein
MDNTIGTFDEKDFDEGLNQFQTFIHSPFLNS